MKIAPFISFEIKCVFYFEYQANDQDIRIDCYYILEVVLLCQAWTMPTKSEGENRFQSGNCYCLFVDICKTVLIPLCGILLTGYRLKNCIIISLQRIYDVCLLFGEMTLKQHMCSSTWSLMWPTYFHFYYDKLWIMKTNTKILYYKYQRHQNRSILHNLTYKYFWYLNTNKHTFG